MDIQMLIAVGFSAVATILAAVSLYFVMDTRQKLFALDQKSQNNNGENFAEIARVLSEGTMVWQRLVVDCDECSSLISSSRVEGPARDTIGDWLLQLREFCRKSKSEVDHAYQLFVAEAKNLDNDELALQRPDMEKFNKEMRSNVAVISDQLDHTRNVLIGREAISASRFKITLHKPQVMPHFLRKRQKIAELQRRRSGGQRAIAPVQAGAAGAA